MTPNPLEETTPRKTPTPEPPETDTPDTDDEPTLADLLPTLIQLLSAGTIDIPTLCDKLAATPEFILEMLESTEYHDHLNLQMKLTQASIRLQALHAAPQAVQTLKDNLSSDKPEVARRSAVALCHITGIPTSSPPRPRPAGKDGYPEVDGTTRLEEIPDPVSARISAGLELLAEAEQTTSAGFSRNFLSDEKVLEILHNYHSKYPAPL